jgi:hypothetical protein
MKVNKKRGQKNTQGNLRKDVKKKLRNNKRRINEES